jgi:hypothetical protein
VTKPTGLSFLQASRIFSTLVSEMPLMARSACAGVRRRRRGVGKGS